MRLIINGKDMPKSCYDCDLYSGEGFLCPLVIETTNDWDLEAMYKRVDECPFVEIPTPHGRLIDADKLQTAIYGCLCENCQTFPCEKGIGCLIEDVFNLLDEAPTIIEAEVSE